MNIQEAEMCTFAWKAQIWDFWFQPLCLCETQSDEPMVSPCLAAIVKHGQGMMVWGCLAGGMIGDLFKIQGTLTSMATTAFWFVWVNRTITHNKLWGYVEAIWSIKSDGGLFLGGQSSRINYLNQAVLVWDELDLRVKKKWLTSTQHSWEVFHTAENITGENWVRIKTFPKEQALWLSKL